MEHGRYIIDLHLNKIGNAYIEFFNIIDMNKLVTRFIAIIAAIATLFVTKAVGAEREYLPILEDGKSWVMVEKSPGEQICMKRTGNFLSHLNPIWPFFLI